MTIAPRLFAPAAVALALLLGACSTGAAREALERTVVVKIHHSRFSPSKFEFDKGTTVTFVVVNHDPIAHEFLIGDQAAQDAHEFGTEPHHGAKPGEMSLPAGARRSTTYTFTEAGRLLIGCHLPNHYDYGMRGEIVVRS
jgi:uncharacterized cupredoxin-like copper-binding protein